MEKPTVGSPFFRAFPSDLITKATKDGNVHFFIHSFTFRDELIIVSENSENFLKLPGTQCCQFKGAVMTCILRSDLQLSEQDFVTPKA